MGPSVLRCSTTRKPSAAVWTYTRTGSPRASGGGPLGSSHTRTGFSSRVAGGGGAWGAVCKSTVRSGRITETPFGRSGAAGLWSRVASSHRRPQPDIDVIRLPPLKVPCPSRRHRAQEVGNRRAEAEIELADGSNTVRLEPHAMPQSYGDGLAVPPPQPRPIRPPEHLVVRLP